MTNFHKVMFGVIVYVAVVGSGALAATTNASDVSVAPTPTKAAEKAQRKADRKAARAKKNSELGDLKKNGYQPGADQLNYPQNLQNAEKKSAAAKANPASSK